VYSPRELQAKRVFDAVAAGVGLCAVAPVLAAVALAVKSSSPGPILFRQARVGLGGNDFKLLKFRSMRVTEGGPLVTAANDSRITPVGAFLRRTKLDELPSLLNVLRGDLSLVGPRPEVRRYVDLYPPADRQFLAQFRPGITDPTTIRFRNEEQILERAEDRERAYVTEILPIKLQMYRDYLEQASFVNDFLVLARTMRAILMPSVSPRE
jgi:lipopolysaccharide/colanic/teichoic acid biosynthesis glycosyltransferase